MKKKRLVLNIGISFAVLIAVTALFIFNNAMKAPPSRLGKASNSVTIQPGSSAGQIASLLKVNNIIRDEVVFKLYLKLSGREKELKAGLYRIEAGTSLPELVRILVSGKVSMIKVTIPEGATISRIAALLDLAKVCAREEFIIAANDEESTRSLGIPAASFEGYLYPDTYLLPEDGGAAQAISAMVDTFRTRMEGFSGGKNFPAEELHRIVTLASIVEREYRIAGEAPIIASVFINRLGIGMPLQSCATVVYVLTEREGKPHPELVLYSDLEIQDPYNTYLARGLPPGPIANPGETSLKAVLYPAENDYLYFRLDDSGTGTHRFSRSFVEHSLSTIPVKGYQ